MTQNISGTITEEFKVWDVSKYSKFGSIVEIGNIPWKLCVRWETKDNVKYLAIFTCCGFKSNLWSCKARVDYRLKKANGNAQCMVETACYNVNKLVWGYSTFIKTEDLILPSNGYVTTGKFEISVEIEILESVGFHKIGITDFSITRNLDTEIELIVGDRKLYVDKLALMCFSSVFRETESAGNRDARIIENHASFETFLPILHHSNQKITDSNVDALLKLAEQYDVEFLTAHCEDFLISSKTISTVEKLRLSEVYKLSELQTKVLEKLTKIELMNVKGKIMKTDSVLTNEALFIKMGETSLTLDELVRDFFSLRTLAITLTSVVCFIVIKFVTRFLLDVFLGPDYPKLAECIDFAVMYLFLHIRGPYIERFFDD